MHNSSSSNPLSMNRQTSSCFHACIIRKVRTFGRWRILDANLQETLFIYTIFLQEIRLPLAEFLVNGKKSCNFYFVQKLTLFSKKIKKIKKLRIFSRSGVTNDSCSSSRPKFLAMPKAKILGFIFI